MNMRPMLLLNCLAACFFSIADFNLNAGQIPTDFSQHSKPATLKILLAKEADKILLEVKGRYQIFDPESQILITSGILSKRAFLTPSESGLKWGESLPSIHRIRIVPGDSQTTMLVNGIEYRGCLEIYSTENKLGVINEIDVEHYLKSTLNQQFPNKKGLEFLDAVAIVARTNAYYLAARNPQSVWHLDAKEINYLGHGITLQNVLVEKAVENTQHMILTFKGGPFAAAWTEDSAGRTADFSSMYRKNISTPLGVEVPLALKDREKHKWSFSVTKRHLARIANLDSVSSVDRYLDKNSKKVYALKVVDGDESQSIDFFALQKSLGEQNIRSSDFTVSLRGDHVVFEGFGSGPGVGLCLYSAEIMAKHGTRAPQILSAFFPETTLVNLRNIPAQISKN